MGISELWNIIEGQKVAMTTTPEDEATKAKELHCCNSDYPKSCVGHFRRWIIGVDTPVIMSQCIAGTYGANKFNGMVPLEIFFYKLCHLSQSWSSVVFVFDGPNRPKIKRGREIPVEDEPDWYGPCQRLIKAFGFHVHMAPGEAEAELAALNNKGEIDVILTGDSDSFIFGAYSVLRSTTVQQSPTSGRNPDVFSLFKISLLREKQPSVFSPGGLLLMALLLGGDYAPGVKGCGATTAYELAKCDYGERLYTTCHEMEGRARRQAISTLLDDICAELKTNSQRRLQRRNHVAARFLTEAEFPSNEVIDYYIHPVTSFSGGDGVDSSAWTTVNELDVGRIARIASEQLGSNFRRGDDIIARFYSNIWPGALKQMLLSPSLLIRPDEGTIETGTSNATIISVKERQERRTTFRSTVSSWFRIIFLTEQLRWTLTESLKTLELGPSKTRQVAPKKKLSEISIWVPAAFVPPLVKAMGNRRKVPKHMPQANSHSSKNPQASASSSLLGALDAAFKNQFSPVAGPSTSVAHPWPSVSRSLSPFPMTGTPTPLLASHISSPKPCSTHQHHHMGSIDLTTSDSNMAQSNNNLREYCTFIDLTEDDDEGY